MVAGFSRPQWLLFAILVVSGVALGGMGVLIGNQGAENPIRTATLQATQRLAVASVSPLSSDSSSWYCSWYLPGKGGLSSVSVLLANTSSNELTATVSNYSGNTKQSRSLKIPAHSFLRYPETVIPALQSGSVSFIANGGGTVAEIEVSGQLGSGVAPCNSSPSANWVAIGPNTQGGSSSGISIFNPFGQNAVVDMSLNSTSQHFSPGALQGMVIAPYSSKQIDLAQFFPGHTHIAVSVSTRIGRVVVGGIVAQNDNGYFGLAASATFPAPASQWGFPLGELSENQNQEILIYNPNSYKVKVGLHFSYLDLTEVTPPSTSTSVSPMTSQADQSTSATGPKRPTAAGATYDLSQTIDAKSVGVVSVKTDTTMQLGLSYKAQLTVSGGFGVVAAEEFIGSTGNPNARYQVVGGTPLTTQHWIALYDPSAMGVANPLAWLATLDTGNSEPVSQKTPLVDLGPTYLAPTGKTPASLPTAQAKLAHSSSKVLKAPSHLNSVGSLSSEVTGLIVSSKTPFALGSVMGTTPGDLYVVPVLPFAN